MHIVFSLPFCTRLNPLKLASGQPLLSVTMKALMSQLLKQLRLHFHFSIYILCCFFGGVVAHIFSLCILRYNFGVTLPFEKKETKHCGFLCELFEVSVLAVLKA